MADAEPRTFVVPDQDAMVRLANVRMHRTFEADRSGKTTIHVWVEAEAAPAEDEFASIEAAVVFSFYNDKRRLGDAVVRDIKFADKDDVAKIRADDDLRIESHETITHLEARIESAKLTRSSAEMRLDPE